MASKNTKATKALPQKQIVLIGGGLAILLVIFTAIYMYGVSQGRTAIHDASRSSIVEALVDSEAETEVSSVLTDAEEAVKVDALIAAAEKEAKATKEAEDKKTTTSHQTETSTKEANDESDDDHEEKKVVMRGVDLTNPLVSVEADAVIFKANLPEPLVGACKVFLQKVGDKAGAWHYNKSSTPRSTCVTSIARSQLSKGVWNYELTFMSDTIYGQTTPKGSFTIE